MKKLDDIVALIIDNSHHDFIASESDMPTTDFIDFLIAHDALKFGNFTLKSGRQSPYFFNLGVFNTGKALMTLGRFYANALIESGFQYDVLFGPAYKGIPLVSATAIALYHEHHIDIPYCFNRKEAKTHGDAGMLVGAPLTGHAVMLDDVITAGTTIRETTDLMSHHPASLNGILIAFDRQECTHTIDAPIKSIITLQDVLAYLQDKPHYKAQYEAIVAYQNTSENTN